MNIVDTQMYIDGYQVKLVSDTSYGSVQKATLDFFAHFRQTTIRVYEAEPANRQLRVPCEQVFQDIFDTLFIELPNGFLKYKQKKDRKRTMAEKTTDGTFTRNNRPIPGTP